MRNTRMGNEMILELAAKLGGTADMNKTAAKKDDDDKDKDKDEDKKDDKKDDDKDEKGKGCPECEGKLTFGKCFSDDCSKSKKKDKKDAAVMDVLNGLSKLASDLDEMGADDASAAVDEALQVIVRNIQREQAE